MGPYVQYLEAIKMKFGVLPIVHPKALYFQVQNSKLSFTPLNSYTSSKVLCTKPLWYLSVDVLKYSLCIPKFEVTLKLSVNERGNLVKKFLSFANSNVWAPASIG